MSIKHERGRVKSISWLTTLRLWFIGKILCELFTPVFACDNYIKLPTTYIDSHARPSTTKAIKTNAILSFLDMPNLFINEGNLDPNNITASAKSRVSSMLDLVYMTY